MKPRLSVCIPTFQRGSLLAKSLQSLAHAALKAEAWCEIVVSDNASSDQTADVVEDFKETWPSVRYYRNEQNIGAERNFYRVVELARGDYVLILGDDDLVATGIFEQIEARMRERPELIVCNHSVYNSDFTRLHKRHFLRTDAPESFDNPDEILATFGAGLGFISAVVFRRESFLRVDRSDYERYAEVGFSFLFTAYAMLGRPCHVAYIAAPLILNRGSNSIVPDWERSFVDGIALVFDELGRRGYSSGALVRAKTLALRNYILKHALNARIAAPPANVLSDRLRQHYADCSYYWFIIRPLWLLPPFALRLMRGASRLLRRSLRRAAVHPSPAGTS